MCSTNLQIGQKESRIIRAAAFLMFLFCLYGSKPYESFNEVQKEKEMYRSLYILPTVR